MSFCPRNFEREFFKAVNGKDRVNRVLLGCFLNRWRAFPVHFLEEAFSVTDLTTGLTQREVEVQVQKYGFNEFEEQRVSTFIRNLLKILGDPMGLMLLALSLIYWILKEHNNAIILMIAYIPIVGVDVLLELRSQTALRSLKRTLKTTCQVLRGGKTISIPTRNLVPGALLLLEEGQAIPADGKLVDSSHLTIDEASVTGESMPIEKSVGAYTLSGTTVLTGTGMVEVEKIGLSSQIGSIAKVLKEFDSVASPLLRSINKIVRIVFLIAMVVAIIIFIEGILKSEGFAPSLIAALTLAMAAIPEEFPLVFTLYLSLAAYRLSKKGVLVKSLPAVEGLGSVDVICTDKTGTLTEGKFRLERILKLKDDGAIEDQDMQALIFSCEPKAVDAMEASIFEWVKSKNEPIIADLHKKWFLKFDYSFDNVEKYMSHVWQETNGQRQIIAMKGALEGVLKHCAISLNERKVILALANREAESGRRLLGLATKVGDFSGVRSNDEDSLSFIGILSFTDPVRESVREAVRVCVEHGLQIKMLTGDHLLTAHSIADKIQLPHEHDQLFTGPQLELMSSDERARSFKKGVIFARLKPEQKLQLVKALKEDGNIVAMTGDGINDAPALKLADIGISMGDRATDVARSTAQIVLLKNDFGGIAAAVLEGRRVLRSLGQSFGYLIAFHIPIVGLALFQAFFLETSILFPIHIVLMELIVHPVSAFVFDESGLNAGTKKREFISRRNILGSAMRGVFLTSISLAVFYFIPGSAEVRRSLSVLVLVTGNIGLLLAEMGGILLALRKPMGFRRSWIASLVLLGLAGALGYIPRVTALFSLDQPRLYNFSIIVGIGVSIGFMSADFQGNKG
jgi:Ca2+-transporting ATPase